MNKRTLFIGDVHGCYDELLALVDKVGLNAEDHLYFVGDLINKGPKSLEVVEWVRNRPNTWSVLGNHEFYMFSSHIPDIGQGNHSWIESYYQKIQILSNEIKYHGHEEYLKNLPHIIEHDEFIVVHGGLHPDYGKHTPKEIATFIREYQGAPWYTYYTGEKPIIYGHWASDGLRIRKNTIGLDTGCCFGGHLTAYCLETGEIWQIRANKVYKKPANWCSLKE